MADMENFLDTKEGLSFVANDKDLYKILLDAYAEESGFDPAALMDLIKRKEFEAAAKIVHKAKGASYQVGAKKFGDKAQVLENILRGKSKPDASQRSPEELAALAQDFCDAYQKCLAEAAAAANEL